LSNNQVKIFPHIHNQYKEKKIISTRQNIIVYKPENNFEECTKRLIICFILKLDIQTKFYFTCIQCYFIIGCVWSLKQLVLDITTQDRTAQHKAEQNMTNFNW